MIDRAGCVGVAAVVMALGAGGCSSEAASWEDASGRVVVVWVACL